MTDPDKPIKSRTAAHKYIVGLGYKVSQSKVYEDFKAGKLGKQEDGTFSPRTLEAYARAYLEPIAGKVRDDGGSAAATKRLLADADLRAVQADRMRLKLAAEEGLLMPRQEHELELAARAQFFVNQVGVFCHRLAPRIIACCAGDEAKTPELTQFLLEETAVWLDAYAQDKVFVAEDMIRG
jgi:hypothetical protein